MTKWLVLVLERLAASMTTHIELPAPDGQGTRIAWIVVSTETGVIWLEESGDAATTPRRARSGSAGTLLVPFVG
jgi:hypothetical protein